MVPQVVTAPRRQAGTMALAALSILVARLAFAGPAGGAAPATIRIRPIASQRNLPHAFFDQALTSIQALHPRAIFVERERVGQRGSLLFALVAWRAEADAESTELDAVAVNGRRAWDLHATVPAPAYAAARRRLEEELAALAGPPAPPAGELTLTARGQAVSIPADRLPDLLWDLEVLLASCSVETRPGPSGAASGFDLGVRYAQPRDLGLRLRDRPELPILEAHVYAGTARNEGWPLQRLRLAGAELGLAKCDGGATLALLCRPELLPHVREAVTRNCQLSGR